MTVLQIVAGMVVLFGSAQVFIRGAVSLAKILRLPPLVIGTSAAELVTSVVAANGYSPGPFGGGQ